MRLILFVGYTIHYQVLDDKNLRPAKLTDFAGIDLYDLSKAIMVQGHFSGSPSQLKLWVAMPEEDRRARNMDQLLDLVNDQGKFNFSELLKHYRISYKNPISVELPGK